MSHPRRSMRLQMAATPAANKPGAASSSAGQNAPSRKRRRNGNGTEEQTKALTGESVARKRRKGPVAVGILQLPFDLLFEIFAYVSILDLLALNRSTRYLRRIVLDRSARVLWTKALAAPFAYLGPPPLCPSNLAEPAYASLVFETTCSFCGRSTVRSTLLMVIRVRVCVECYGAKQNFVTSTALRVSLGEKYAGIVETFLAPITPASKSEIGHVHPGTRYQADEVKHVTSFVKKHYGQKEAMTIFSAERRGALGVHEDRAGAALYCDAWAQQAPGARRFLRSNDIASMRRTRRNAILDHISALGYDDVAELLRSDYMHLPYTNIHMSKSPTYSTQAALFDKVPFVLNCKPLTDRAWEAHKESLIENIQTLRHFVPIQRRLRALRRAFHDHSDSRALDWRACLDSERFDIGEIYAYNKISAIIQAPLPGRLDVPDPALTNVAFAPILDEFFASKQERLDARRRHLANLLTMTPFTSGFLSTLSGEARLELATTIFRCKLCDVHMNGLYAAKHQCKLSRLPESDPNRLLFDEYMAWLPWNYGNVLQFDMEVSETSVELFRLTGRDPYHTTTTEMETSFVSYFCSRSECEKDMKSIEFMNFMRLGEAALHQLKNPTHADDITVWVDEKIDFTEDV